MKGKHAGPFPRSRVVEIVGTGQNGRARRHADRGVLSMRALVDRARGEPRQPAPLVHEQHLVERGVVVHAHAQRQRRGDAL